MTTRRSRETTIDPRTDYVDAPTAAKILGVPIWKVRHMAYGGHVGFYRLPGSRPRYSRADCERLAGGAVHQAATADA